MPDRGENVHEISYVDELLADGSVHRRYADGRQEWRTRRADGAVQWRDHRGGEGVDEPLGPKLIKRSFSDGSVAYGREAGFGRTLWRDGTLTVNRSSFGGRLGGILAAVTGTAVLGGLALPPKSLTPQEEQDLRDQGIDDPDGGGSDDYGEWGGPGDDGGGDFG
ncbi:hypothetical protein [[Mycobacterium] wendilense]|uniref:DUF2631 domain-containing protein n=1 Tax=[Mycobacterium] wendilense TaxID=3064284 RepID=A0ABN9P6T1_9MYCO|nr:hypothetical protein [Mycolicibacterium sp. MU0050]CAJ1586992.1 hypothetical protein MU0050_004557 [Mycolicibacterium sp. MU0050]